MINLKKLLTESADPKSKILEASDHVRSGLEKVFSSGDAEVSVRRCENVGLGYIKNISEAIKVAKEEAQKVAKTFGYRLDEDQAKFIKENTFPTTPAVTENDIEHIPLGKTNSETDMSNPAEKREVQIGKDILSNVSRVYADLGTNPFPLAKKKLKEIEELAKELIQMHGAK